MENNIIRFKCPNCQQALAIIKPEKSVLVRVTCPQCKNHINVKIQEKAIRLPEQERIVPKKILRLVVAEGPQINRQAFPLRHGSNVIGRDDDDTVQDIALTGDMTISRRSVDLQVSQHPDGSFGYVLKVLNAKNLVYVNRTPLHVGNRMILRPGDSIHLGETKLMLSE